MSELFTPYRIGPVELRNRTIRSAAFEAMCPGQRPLKLLAKLQTFTVQTLLKCLKNLMILKVN